MNTTTANVPATALKRRDVGGGLSLVQDPSEAAYASMPLLNDHVDGVLPVAEIAKVLSALAAERATVAG